MDCFTIDIPESIFMNRTPDRKWPVRANCQNDQCHMADNDKSALPFKHLVFGEMFEVSSNRPGWHFALTIRFGEELFEFRRPIWLGIGKARVYVGVNCAELFFDLIDCSLPDEDWEFDPPGETQRTIERRRSSAVHAESDKETEVQIGVTAQTSVTKSVPSIKAAASKKVRVAGKSTLGAKIEIEDSYKRRLAYIVASGGPSAPKWRIEAPEDQPNLSGTILKGRRFARAEVIGLKPRIEMRLDIPEHAIVVRDEEGIFKSINRQKIAKIRIKKALSRTSHILGSASLPGKGASE